MPKFIAVVPFLTSGSHREVEAHDAWEAMDKAMREAHDAGRWSERFPPPGELHLMEGNEHEDTLDSASYEVARRSWEEYHALDVGPAEASGAAREKWMDDNYVGMLHAFGPIAS